jgi:hypothetical protein
VAAKSKRLELVKAEAQDISACFNDLLEKTNRTEPRPADVDALRALLRENEEARLWERVAGCMRIAQNHLLEHTPLSLGIVECWRPRLVELYTQLAGESPSKVEELLAQHTVLCWLRLACVEASYTNITSQSITLTLAAHWERRLTLAQRRFTRACETLERVRMMMRRGACVNVTAGGSRQSEVSQARREGTRRA